VNPPPADCELTPLDVASGLVFGFGPPERVPNSDDLEGGRPLAAIEHAILPALLRPPCVLCFTGGRGSSLVLAVAVQLARREGLELPVPATIRMRGSANADESASQERLVIRLGLTEWVRLQIEEECDLVGPAATAVLRRHGFLWPSDAHLWTPLLDWAFGGSLLTGVGYSRAGGEAPAFVFRDLRPLSWLRPSAKREVRTLWMADSVRRRRAQRDLAWWLRLRQVRIRIGLLQRMGAARRVELCHPLLDPGVVAALAAQPKRSEIEPVLLEGLRSPPSTPTAWAAALWGPASRELAADWRGEDVDQDLVDIDALAREWSLPQPDPRTYLLMQSIALARERRVAGDVAAAGPM
jgi:asparagine synthase (glutamine-hydrolysing)